MRPICYRIRARRAARIARREVRRELRLSQSNPAHVNGDILRIDDVVNEVDACGSVNPLFEKNELMSRHEKSSSEY